MKDNHLKLPSLSYRKTPGRNLLLWRLSSTCFGSILKFSGAKAFDFSFNLNYDANQQMVQE
jgi:hypothetical protein